MEPGEKISFGFSKLVKKPTLIPKKQAEEPKKVELIDCLEGQSIKIKDAVEEVVNNEPLSIPLKENKKNLIDRIKEVRAKRNESVVDDRPDSELTLDELTERELIREAKERMSGTQNSTKVFLLPKKEGEEDFSLEGEKEPTLEDYEKIPINDFGMAMLRGMGWKEGEGIGKKPTRVNLTPAPDTRPKGLGLGANKMVKKNAATPSVDKNGEALELKKGVFVKIIAGAHRGRYGEVLGLDDEASRVIVKTSLKDEVLTLNEFLVVPVKKEEFLKFSKVLNNAKLEDYKQEKRDDSPKRTQHRDDSIQIIQNSSSDSSEPQNRAHKRKDKRRHRDKSRSPRRRSGKHGKSSRHSRRVSSSSSTLSSDPERERRRRRRGSKR